MSVTTTFTGRRRGQYPGPRNPDLCAGEVGHAGDGLAAVSLVWCGSARSASMPA